MNDYISVKPAGKYDIPTFEYVKKVMSKPQKMAQIIKVKRKDPIDEFVESK